jgi:hypothetical protein
MFDDVIHSAPRTGGTDVVARDESAGWLGDAVVAVAATGGQSRWRVAV